MASKIKTIKRKRKVSAVIPTRNRPTLVVRAVRSALSQTYEDLEVIVIVDGPDDVTAKALKAVKDRRLKVIVLKSPVGAAQARNLAVKAARGGWIAFLDDDDEWLPKKIELQMERAQNSKFLYPIVSCELFARKSTYEVVWPRTEPTEPLSEYLLARNSWSYGDGLLSTITLLFPKDLFDKVRFRPELPRHQDWDWVLRAAKQQGAGIEFIARPLAVWHQAEHRKSISTATHWRGSFDWAEDIRELMTDRAYASFLATQVAPQAARAGDWAAFMLGKLTIELGRIQPADVVAQLLQLFEAKAKAKNVTLTAKVAPYLPAVLADHSRLLQIFTNLLENALKFTEPGGVITISAATFPEDPKFVQWSVADTGQGIHPENLSRIFERLYQEQSAVHNRQGLGLGLAICKELVERHAGRIWVDSKPGKGSVFSFTTPVFSLLEITSPLLVREGKVRPATVVAVEIASPTKTVPADTWEYSRRRCREVIERCMLPDKDVVLPSMHASDREVVFVLACTDLKGAAVLEARISSQLGSIPEVAKACNIRTFCVSLPEVPPDRTQLMEQLEWISRKIEELALRAVGA